MSGTKTKRANSPFWPTVKHTFMSLRALHVMGLYARRTLQRYRTIPMPTVSCRICRGHRTVSVGFSQSHIPLHAPGRRVFSSLRVRRLRRRRALGRDRKPTPFQYSPDKGRSVYFARLTAVSCLKGHRSAVREGRRDDVEKVRFAQYRFQRVLYVLYTVTYLVVGWVFSPQAP